ncbi:MAG: universal stress protein [Gammaproteobacteria bacterium]
MYKKIMVPVDLAHLDALQKPLQVAADMARHYEADVCYVSVTTSMPGPVAKTPAEYEKKLAAFAAEQASSHGQACGSRVFFSHDPAADLSRTLVKAVEETGADLVVMGTHLPRKLDAIMPSRGGKLAKLTNVSVFLVRP